MVLAHYNDGKEKYQSHEIYFKEDPHFYHQETGLFSHNLSDIRGYGETKEEALDDFKKKFDYIMYEMKAIENLLHGSDVYTNSMIEVDCSGNEITK